MTCKTTIAIRSHSDERHDRLLEMMDQCGVDQLPDVPDSVAVKFLENLEEEK